MDIYNEFIQFGLQVDIYDPFVDAEEVNKEYGIDIHNKMPNGIYRAVVLCVAHDEFKKLDFERLKRDDVIIFDSKSFVPRHLVDARL